MNNLVEDHRENRFANGQSSHDLRATLCSAELETQLMEAVDSVGDFLRFVKSSTRVDAKIRGCFEMEFKAMSPLPEMTE
jgi:hypothetical protein